MLKSQTQLEVAGEVFDTEMSLKIERHHSKLNVDVSELLSVRKHIEKDIGCHLHSFDLLVYPDSVIEDYIFKGEGYCLEISISSFSPTSKQKRTVQHADTPLAKDKLVYLFKQDYQRRRENSSSPFCNKVVDFIIKLFVICNQYAQFSFEHDSGYWSGRYEDRKRNCTVDFVLQFEKK